METLTEKYKTNNRIKDLMYLITNEMCHLMINYNESNHDYNITRRNQLYSRMEKLQKLWK